MVTKRKLLVCLIVGLLALSLVPFSVCSAATIVPETIIYLGAYGGTSGWGSPANAYDNDTATNHAITWSSGWSGVSNILGKANNWVNGTKMQVYFYRGNTAVVNASIEILVNNSTWTTVYNSTPTFGAYANYTWATTYNYTGVRFNMYKTGTINRAGGVAEVQFFNASTTVSGAVTAECSQSVASSLSVLGKWGGKITPAVSFAAGENVFAQRGFRVTPTVTTSSTWNNLERTSYKITPSWAASAVFNTATKTSYFIRLSNTATAAFNVLAVYTHTGVVFVATLSASIASGWNTLTRANYNIRPTVSLTYAENALTKTTWNIALTQAVVASANVFASLKEGAKAYVAALSVSTVSAWNTLTKWSATINLAANTVSVWTLAAQRPFYAGLSASVTTGWNAYAVLTVFTGQRFVAELSQTLSTSLTPVLQWFGSIDFAQQIAVSWETVTGWLHWGPTVESISEDDAIAYAIIAAMFASVIVGCLFFVRRRNDVY